MSTVNVLSRYPSSSSSALCFEHPSPSARVHSAPQIAGLKRTDMMTDKSSSSSSNSSSDDSSSEGTVQCSKRQRKSFSSSTSRSSSWVSSSSCSLVGSVTASSGDAATRTVSSHLAGALADRGLPDRVNPQGIDLLYLWDDACDGDALMDEEGRSKKRRDATSGYNRLIPSEVVEAMKTGERRLIQNWLSINGPSWETATTSLSSFRTSHSNETPLHLICHVIGSTIASIAASVSSGQSNDNVSILRSMMDILDDLLAFESYLERSGNKNRYAVTSLFVQDSQGRTPLHSLVLGVAMTSETTNWTRDNSSLFPTPTTREDVFSWLVEALRKVLFPVQQQQQPQPHHHESDRACRDGTSSSVNCCMSLLFTDNYGKTPFEYLQVPATEYLIQWIQNDSIVDHIVAEWTSRDYYADQGSYPHTPSITTGEVYGSNDGDGDDDDGMETTTVGDDVNITTVGIFSSATRRMMINPFRRRSSKMTAMEHVDRILNFSGLTDSIMEMGFEV